MTYKDLPNIQFFYWGLGPSKVSPSLTLYQANNIFLGYLIFMVYIWFQEHQKYDFY